MVTKVAVLLKQTLFLVVRMRVVFDFVSPPRLPCWLHIKCNLCNCCVRADFISSDRFN